MAESRDVKPPSAARQGRLSRLGLVVTIIGWVIAFTGLAIVVADQFIFVGSSAVLCSDPEEFRCSGHLIRGVPNLATGLVTIVAGALLVLLAHFRLRRKGD